MGFNKLENSTKVYSVKFVRVESSGKTRLRNCIDGQNKIKQLDQLVRQDIQYQSVQNCEKYGPPKNTLRQKQY